MIQRCVLRQETESRDDPAAVSEADHESCADTSLRMTLQIHNIPANDDWTGCEGAHSNETYAKVLGGEMMAAVDCQQDTQAGDCNGDADCDEREA